MSQFENIIKKFDYSIPEKLIAQKPASPRDSAKLLVYDRKSKTIKTDIFSNLYKYLPKNSLLVFNQTKVIPARFEIIKETGGKARLLYIAHSKFIQVMSDRKLVVNSTISISPKIKFQVIRQDEKYYFLKPLFSINKIINILEKHGRTPIPPYIKNTPLSKSKLKEEYQTIFAKKSGSIAAPTASLHFTKRLLNNLEKRGIKVAYITLHVGLGTFAPLTEENILRGKLHSEYFEINKKTINQIIKAKKEKTPVIAVGTTVTRTLESAFSSKGGVITKIGSTDLFIKEGYKFKIISGLITNFHVPKSSLMMLVSTLVERNNLLKLYKYAVRRKFRFFSFGDGMFIK